ncbi:MAG: DJ-1/PfpI family protein [Clostridiales bacterium]|nr:DJ-1/PfpI family protein [Clostridiales bacterium]
MSKVAVMLAEGFEDVEAITAIDLMRRAGIEVTTVSVTDEPVVTTSHKITLKTDASINSFDLDSVDMIVLPGGMPGTINLGNTKKLTDKIIEFNNKGKYLAAICAAPTVFGSLGILEGKRACCYPGMEDGLTGASKSTNSVEVDGNIITSRGVGTAIDFALTIISVLVGNNKADEIAKGIVYRV